MTDCVVSVYSLVKFYKPFRLFFLMLLLASGCLVVFKNINKKPQPGTTSSCLKNKIAFGICLIT